MRFLADMPISPKTVEFLNNLGHEAVRLTDIDMMHAEDEDIIEYARTEKYVILTMDLDFGELLAIKRLSEPSVIIFRLENPTVVRINNILNDNLKQIEQDLMNGSIVIIEKSRLRIRELPIKS
ncbi:MAG: hypothetical protein MAG551_00637 [Candidatus Scalindua arabica]|uniref:DUF5615 domain-containing protein n=1 Tax=Candidatus Scalindua arabica TaxID=1127984 RepID=A0A941ZYN5_9BACT|nr:hypothetical protein [Candidatus Scalindua arabica]